MATTSYIKIISSIQTFANQHLQVKRVGFDFYEQLNNFATLNEQYPILFVAPSNTNFLENVNMITISVYCFDIITKDRSNINTIISDTNQILNDLYHWFANGDLAGIDLINVTNATPMNNALLDYTAGWQMQITLVVDPFTFCDIPFDNYVVS